MSTTMRAKFVVGEVSDVRTEHGGTSQKVSMRPVTTSSYGDNGENEDNTFARYTPSGEIRLQITNPDLNGKINPGEVYYIDFTPAN